MDDIKKLIELAGITAHSNDPEVGKLTISLNKIIDKRDISGLIVDAKEEKSGVSLDIRVLKNHIIPKPAHLCFGVLDKTASQKIKLKVHVEDGASIAVFGHCVFPYAEGVKHLMDGEITIGKGASFTYFERHVHDDKGGVDIHAKATVSVGPKSRYKTVFELVKGRVGRINFDYSAVCGKDAVADMEARVSAFGDDFVLINESADLAGANSRSALKSRIAVRDRARAEVRNTIRASAPFAHGHVDCTEILRGKGIVRAFPNVEVLHPKARVTHEAKLGGIEGKQLETLMARGLTEREAEELIIEGLLS